MEKNPPHDGNAGGSPHDSSHHDPTVIMPPSGSSPAQPASAPILEVGGTYAGYRVLRMLGRGGMAEVYAAEQIEDGHHVALKALSPRYRHSPDAVSRFLREGRLAASINHPNSVYIYGTAQAGEILLIAMEMMPGGTLGERVAREGPFAPTEAVTATEQLIAGLAAAHAKGILHRDIKPTNCFIDHEGEVKIGDYGLSIAPSAEEETQLTVAGSFLGTPAYASPEQVRGTSLDVRSDIYSLGATLYCLLTGRGPFDGKQGGQLLAAILEEVPADPRESRPQLPAGLARVVMRCLAKQPAERFQSYDDLRAALQPFGPSPFQVSGLGIRFAAGFLDFLVMQIASSLLLLLHPVFGEMMMGDPSLHPHDIFWLNALGMVPSILYGGLLEGIWGFTLGKGILGLRVIGPEGERPGFVRGFARAGVFYLPWLIPAAVYFSPLSLMISGIVADMGRWVILALLFAPARRRNGFRALHGRLTATRVVHRARKDAHRDRIGDGDWRPQPIAIDTLGPYAIVGRLGAQAAPEILLGHDPELKRSVWIARLPEGSPPLPEWRRDLGRAARLRWVNGRRSETEAWDVYEALDGQSLLSLLTDAHPWRSVRHWLLDLAAELQASAADESQPPELSLAHVWITARGRAKLLDFVAPGTEALPAAAEPATTAEFLHQVAASALLGRPLPLAECAEWDPALPLPLHARTLLERLRTGVQGASAAELRAIRERDTLISRPRRSAHLAAQICLPVLIAVSMGVGAYQAAVFNHRNPEVKILEDLLEEREALQSNEGEHLRLAALDVYLAGRFGALIEDPAPWEAVNFTYKPRIRALREEAQRIISDQARPSPQELATAHEVVSELVANAEREMQERPHPSRILAKIILLVGGGVGGIVAVLSIALSAIFFRGLLLRFFGFAVVDRRGRRASRRRYLARSCTAAALPLLIAGCALLHQWMGDHALLVILGFGLILLWIAGVIATAATPARGPHDRVTGTRLVPV